MGGQQDAQEDMFAKLESMRSVITEVNTQFKDPARLHRFSVPIFHSSFLTKPIGKDDLCLRVHLRILIAI
jgi:hypothetical protein